MDHGEANDLMQAAQAIAARNVELRVFLLRLLDPEDLGHAVTQEVREEAHKLLNDKRRH